MEAVRVPRRGRPSGRGGDARRAFAAVACAASLAGPAAASTERCPVPASADPALASVAPAERIRFLRERLDAVRPAAERWTIAWVAIDGALAAGQLAAVPFASDRPTRVLLAAGGATSALGVLQAIFLPVTPPAPGREAAPDGCAALGALEEALARGARNQALGAGAAAQAGNALVNAAFGVASGVTARRWSNGALTFAIGWALGEAQILTQPTALVGDLARYRAADLRPERRVAWRLSVTPLPPRGLAVEVAF